MKHFQGLSIGNVQLIKNPGAYNCLYGIMYSYNAILYITIQSRMIVHLGGKLSIIDYTIGYALM